MKENCSKKKQAKTKNKMVKKTPHFFKNNSAKKVKSLSLEKRFFDEKVGEPQPNKWLDFEYNNL